MKVMIAAVVIALASMSTVDAAGPVTAGTVKRSKSTLVNARGYRCGFGGFGGYGCGYRPSYCGYRPWCRPHYWGCGYRPWRHHRCHPCW